MDTRVSLNNVPHVPKVALQGEVLHLYLKNGETLICAFSKKGGPGGLVGIQADNAVSVAKAILPLVSGITAHGVDAKDLVFKLVGPAHGLRLVRQFLFDRQMSFVSDFETSGDKSEVYFYSSSGRLRVANLAPATQASSGGAKKKVLIVDDSATMRRILRHIFSEHPEMEVCGEADRPSKVEKMIEDLRPDVVSLDIHMPEMDGITLLKRIMKRMPLPVVMVSSVSYDEGVEVLKAIELGAVDYIEKPKAEDFDEVAPEIVRKILQAAKANVRGRKNDDAPPPPRSTGNLNTDIPIIIGASTGGTEAIKEVLIRLPKDVPAILIAQHIPAVYSRAFAERLNDLCAFSVREAVAGEKIEKGVALIAPGGFQMAVRKSGSSFELQVGKQLYPSCYEPSVDLLFESAAEAFGGKSIGVILTGMGSDGAHGLLKMRQAGAHTVAQDQATSVVFGMPRVAIEQGAAEIVSPLDGIAASVMNWLTPVRKAA